MTERRSKADPMTAKPSLDDIARDYSRMVSTVCRRMILDAETARDAAQQVWTEIVKSYPSFRGESKISTWIYTITRRAALEFARNERTITTRFLRSYSLQEEFQPAATATDPERVLWVKEMCDKCLTGMLHCFDNEARLAFIFRNIVELSYQDIAEILEKDEAAVRQMISRSRKRLLSFMTDKCILSNPDNGNCRCRMTTWVRKIDLVKEYEKIRTTVRRVNLFKESELVLPRKNYWESLL